MKTLHLDDLKVESFATGEGFANAEPVTAAEPILTPGLECNRTLDYSCTACDCQTPRYNCV